MERLILLVAVIAHAAGGQIADSTRSPIAGTVTGVVRDSVAQMPLPGATVQLVAANDPAKFVGSAVSDIYGQFTFHRVPGGKYKIGFIHPMLDSLGVEIPARDIEVVDEAPIETELGTPSSKRLRALYCSSREGIDSASAVVVGVVRNAYDGAPVANASVIAQWREYSIGKKGISESLPHVASTTNGLGWFALCNVPNQGTVTLVANVANDSTQIIEVAVPRDRLVRRELFLGGHALNGRLSGIVVAEADNLPIQGALVSIVDGPGARANAVGEFAITDAPVGTRMVEVRAIGFYPERRSVDVMNGAMPVRFALSTLKAVLDTVRVKASRLSSRDKTGFEDRRHNGPGRYLTSSAIQKIAPVFLSDLFRGVSGLRVGYASDTLATDMAIGVSPDAMSNIDRRLLMRGISGDWCAAAIYLDGLHFPGLGASELDAWLRPGEVAGVEVYSEASVPNEFRQERSGCGSVVIWRKR
jgi:hypothetical protein